MKIQKHKSNHHSTKKLVNIPGGETHLMSKPSFEDSDV